MSGYGQWRHVLDRRPSSERSAPSRIYRRLRTSPGPFVIIAKGHSGTRFLASCLTRCGVFLGADLNAAHDSLSWYRYFGRPLVLSDHFPHWPSLESDEGFRADVRGHLDRTLPRFVGGRFGGGHWGWKGSTLFVTPVVAELFPGGRFIHLVRDGRDVALSADGMLNLPYNHRLLSRDPSATVRRLRDRVLDGPGEDRYRLRIIFNRTDVRTWNGATLDRAVAYRNRYQLQMRSWMTHVELARGFGRRFPERYLEVRYEDLCRNPVDEVQRVLDFLALEAPGSGLAWAAESARTGSIGRWRSAVLTGDERRDFERALELGYPVLRDLGYAT